MTYPFSANKLKRSWSKIICQYDLVNNTKSSTARQSPNKNWRIGFSEFFSLQCTEHNLDHAINCQKIKSVKNNNKKCPPTIFKKKVCPKLQNLYWGEMKKKMPHPQKYYFFLFKFQKLEDQLPKRDQLMTECPKLLLSLSITQIDHCHFWPTATNTYLPIAVSIESKIGSKSDPESTGVN